MIGDTIINIPVYRCTQKKFEGENIVEKDRLRAYFQGLLPAQLKSSGYDVSNLVAVSIGNKWKCWLYNEIVGYIRVFVLGDQIRGELFYVSHKRVRRDMKHRKFVWDGDYVFVDTNFLQDNAAILKKLMAALENLPTTSKKLKNRYIDLSCLKTLGPFIDWKALIRKNH